MNLLVKGCRRKRAYTEAEAWQLVRTVAQVADFYQDLDGRED
jgi:hypothetical protein